MIDFDFIERLIRALDASSIDSLDIERGGTRVRLSKTPPVAPSPGAVHAPAPAAAPPPAHPGVGGAPFQPEAGAAERAPPASDLVEITSPMVGTFYRAPAPDAPPYVVVGKRVTPGDPLCIIEAMKLMNELECEVTGTIAQVCVDNAQPVEFGQVLFRVDPS
jgi:acetyl-CoA carboxylase biotin carboxyl carrier protein